MPENTPRLSIPKPLGNEYFNRENFNEILNVIDLNAATNEEVEDLAGAGRTTETVKSVADALETHKQDLASQEVGKGASLIGVQDADGLFTAITVEGALKEAKEKADLAFTQANDIKTKWSSVVGSPLLSSDTSDDLQSKTQTIKNTLATNLTIKGQTSVGAEPLGELADKVALVNTGKRWATGTGTALSNFRAFTVSGLDFRPSLVIVEIDANNRRLVVNDLSTITSTNKNKLNRAVVDGGATNGSVVLSNPSVLNNDGFTVYPNDNTTTTFACKWWAIE